MIVLDTNVMIAIFANHPDMKKRLDTWLQASSIAISIITLTELLTGRKAKEQEMILKAVEDLVLLPFDQKEISLLAAQYRDKFRLKTPNAIIAASCAHGGHQFYTLNKDFQKLDKKWIHVLC